MTSWDSLVQICEKFIPDSHDLEDNPSLISYMLDILETVNLKPHACKILTNSSLAEDLEYTIQMNIAVHPFLPLLPADSSARYKCDVENVIRSHWKKSNDRDPHYYADMFVVHAEKL
ncbi:hypothetical protein IscW_ISCW003244 [Ixodes scapularis]|uniref:Uncharacterized protein n=1 Tax=Ixodes scapularis TaxID=6945 RepID=B7PC50_IXOSC|nr:hypothetical protein IscW_ISCW003244 [Ixodes scapularis]|eukprot:XP_002409333.1 hypothetical protein IscW_ISCW003244 [Ixodes scapularis]